MSKVSLEKKWVAAEIRDIRKGDRVRVTDPEAGDVFEFTVRYPDPVGQELASAHNNFFLGRGYTLEKEVPGVKPGVYVYRGGGSAGNVIMVKPTGQVLVMPNALGYEVRNAEPHVIDYLETGHSSLVYLGDHNGPAKGEYVEVNSG